MAHQFLHPELSETTVDAEVVVTGAEAKHAVTVSRVRVGERIRISNGRGLTVIAEVTGAAPSELRVVVQEVHVEDVPAWAPALVQGLAKGDRDELAVQAATELGVTQIVPWQAARSVARWSGPKLEKGRARWQTIAREASKQSLRSWIPEVRGLVRTDGIVPLFSGQPVLVLDPTAATRLSDLWLADPDFRPAAIVVGPEGGIHPDELHQLGSHGAKRVRLGANVLRTSTAGPAAIAASLALSGRW